MQVLKKWVCMVGNITNIEWGNWETRYENGRTHKEFTDKIFWPQGRGNCYSRDKLNLYVLSQLTKPKHLIHGLSLWLQLWRPLLTVQITALLLQIYIKKNKCRIFYTYVIYESLFKSRLCSILKGKQYTKWLHNYDL